MAENSEKADAAYAEALKRIEECRRQRQVILELSGLYFTALPPEIGQLTELKKLYLNRNLLTTLPPEIGRLKALTMLGLSDTGLTVLPSEIGQLTDLKELWLQHNRLTVLPSCLRR